jgi:UDP-N-acetyl-D-glucosamine dehydrogenase
MLEATGLKAGVDFFLAFSPERVDPGNPKFNTRNVPKVVGGTNPESTELACALYSAAIEHIVSVSSTHVAEMVKLPENTFRRTSARERNRLDVRPSRHRRMEVAQAAATKLRFHAVLSRSGLGGHCIPIDPFYLS